MGRATSRVAAFDIGGTNLRAALVDRRGRMTARLRLRTVTDRSGFMRQLSGAVRELESKGGRVAAVAVGFPGPLRIDEGRALTPPNLPDCHNLPVKKILEDELRLPVFLENDANAAALGEWWLGAAKGARSAVCITLGTGIGGGIVLNGELWHGAGGVAAEFGHITVKRNGRLCGCGRRGCLETYASATGVVCTARAKVRRNRQSLILRLAGGKPVAISAEIIHRAARAGDVTAVEVLSEAGRMLGFAIGGLLGVLNPEVVVVGGGLARAGRMILDPLRNEARRHCFRSAFKSARIVRGRLGDDAGILGAALTAFRAME